MNILLLVSSGPEHALAWRLAQSPQCSTIYAAPGNPDIVGQAVPVTLDPAAVARFCRANAIEFNAVDLEAQVVDGRSSSLHPALYNNN